LFAKTHEKSDQGHHNKSDKDNIAPKADIRSVDPLTVPGISPNDQLSHRLRRSAGLQGDNVSRHALKPLTATCLRMLLPV
jgi:hypothetical protein